MKRVGWIWGILAVLVFATALQAEETKMRSGTFGEYLSEEELSPPEEVFENELLAPLARPVQAVIQSVGSTVEPMLEERPLGGEGEEGPKLKPKEGKVQIDF